MYNTLSHADLLEILPDREPMAHKGDFGRVLLLCGSRGYTGAAALAAMGALRSGSGLVYLGVPESIYTIEATKLLEAIVLPLPDQDGKISAIAWSEIAKMLPLMDAVLLGPGLGQSDGISELLLKLLLNYSGPLVLDADGINCLRDHKDILRGRTAPTVITPHQGEFDRFRNKPCADRITEACELAQDLGIIVVLKGHQTVITDGKLVYINNTGNPGMAVGGSGDVLAGMTVSLIGQGLDPLKAAACAAWIHGTAGDICAKELGQYGMLPSDILSVIPRLMK